MAGRENSKSSLLMVTDTIIKIYNHERLVGCSHSKTVFLSWLSKKEKLSDNANSDMVGELVFPSGSGQSFQSRIEKKWFLGQVICQEMHQILGEKVKDLTCSWARWKKKMSASWTHVQNDLGKCFRVNVRFLKINVSLHKLLVSNCGNIPFRMVTVSLFLQKNTEGEKRQQRNCFGWPSIVLNIQQMAGITFLNEDKQDN